MPVLSKYGGRGTTQPCLFQRNQVTPATKEQTKRPKGHHERGEGGRTALRLAPVRVWGPRHSLRLPPARWEGRLGWEGQRGAVFLGPRGARGVCASDQRVSLPGLRVSSKPGECGWSPNKRSGLCPGAGTTASTGGPASPQPRLRAGFTGRTWPAGPLPTALPSGGAGFTPSRAARNSRGHPQATLRSKRK